MIFITVLSNENIKFVFNSPNYLIINKEVPMKTFFRLSFALLFFFFFSFSFSSAQTGMQHEAAEHPDHIMLTASDLKWSDGPGSLPKGSKVAVLEGNPSKEGAFTIRLKIPANYKIQPHWHPAIEHVSVISGEFYMGPGETFDESKATRLPAEGFAVMQIGTRHFAFTKDSEATIQLHGIGPWDIHYVNPEDDPRKQITEN